MNNNTPSKPACSAELTGRTTYRKHRLIILPSEDREHLQALIRGGSEKARTLTRARVLLLCDRSQGVCRTDDEVAEAAMCHRNTVRLICTRYLDEGLKMALSERPRPGASLRPKITGEVEAQLLAIACSAPPEGRKAWTLKLLAERLVELKLVDSISDVAVMNRLKQIL